LSAVAVGAGAVAWSVPAELATKPTYALLLFIIYIWLEAEARTELDNNNNIISDDTLTHTRARCIHQTLYTNAIRSDLCVNFLIFFPSIIFYPGRYCYIYLYIYCHYYYCIKCAISARAHRPSWTLLNRIRNYIIIYNILYYRYRRRRLDG